MSVATKTVKVECQPDTEIGDYVTVHHMHNSSKYAIGKRPVMDAKGPSYTYQGFDWSCIGNGTVTRVDINPKTLYCSAIVKLD